MTTTPSKFKNFAENFSTLLTPEIWEQALRDQDEKERRCFEQARAMVAKMEANPPQD